jgi:hypothetical protein
MGAHAARAHPDPIRAHGAWVYLFCAVFAGVLVGARGRIEPALMVGTAFAGCFLAGGALAYGARRKWRRLVGGLALATVSGAGALLLGANSLFLVVAVCAAIPTVAAIVLARELGSLSAWTLMAGVGALAMAAPAAAAAGGASLTESALLLMLLWPFYAWRSLEVARPLLESGHWDVVALRRRGLREAWLAALWTVGVVVALSVFF